MRKMTPPSIAPRYFCFYSRFEWDFSTPAWTTTSGSPSISSFKLWPSISPPTFGESGTRTAVGRKTPVCSFFRSEIDITTIIKDTKELRKLEPRQQRDLLRKAAISMLATVRERDHDTPRGVFKGIFHGGCSYLLTYQYLFMKLLNLTIVTVAISKVSNYLDNTNFFWSFKVLPTHIKGPFICF